MADTNLDPRAEEYHPRAPTTHLVDVPPPQYMVPYTTVQLVPLPSPYNDQPPVGPLWYPPPQPYTAPYANTSVAVVPPSAAPTRTVVLSSVPSGASETVIRRELEVFGEVRGVQMERVKDGIIVVNFYDLRDAVKALKEIREQHMQQQTRLRKHFTELGGYGNGTALPLPPSVRGIVCGRAVWAQFGVPACNAVPGGNNQGTVVVFNLDPNVSTFALKKIFEAYGQVKELRETPRKKNQKFVEFYDVRDAARALTEMNGKEINGKHVVIEFSRPGGFSRRFFNASASVPHQNHFPPTPTPKYSPRMSYINSSAQEQARSSSSIYENPSASKYGNGGFSSVRSWMSSLCLDEESGKNNSTRHAKKKEISSSNSTMTTPGKQLLEQQGRNPHRTWKGKHVKKYDSRYLINEDAIISESNFKGTRTTVMIKNIPNKYSQQLLLNMLDNHCLSCNERIAECADDEQQQKPLSSYDFVYLPIDFNNKCNVGYGFVNMTSPEATLRLYKAFHHQHWEVFNSRKICQVTYARVQGLEALKEHFKNSKFPCEMENYLPVVFSPPRDGKRLTEPNPIVVHRQQQQLSHSPSKLIGVDDESKASDDNDDVETKGSNDILDSELNECYSEHDLRQSASNSSGGIQENGGGHGNDVDDKEYGGAAASIVACAGRGD